ncbi:MAG: YjjI family glycine radical enzyme [Bacteroidales bacterium]|nr:YjjI family glycine radical enzyme [Bacteroidales bacterium]
MENTLNIIKNRLLTYEQKVMQLALEAENSLNVLNLSPEIQELIEKEIICDLFEGNAPYRPRYILPDFEKFMKQGSKFLNLDPPTTLLEAVNALLILYKHTPSITSFPVFLGDIDVLLNPFIEDEKSAYPIIKMFLTHLDRTLTDSFVHANIGPKDTLAGRLILQAEKELVNAIPNLTLKYDDSTPDDFAKEAIITGLHAAKPYFANHKMFVDDFGESYGIASCYNGLPKGGGSYTLVRLNLKILAQQAQNKDDFFENILPKGVKLMAEFMDERIRFLKEESGFFESNFLVKEGLIYEDKFTAMFGIHGLAECVNHLNNATTIFNKFGNNTEADDLGQLILEKLSNEVKKHSNKYCSVSDDKFLLHAQCGIGSDLDTSPGCRIPIGDEPDTPTQILQAAKYHKYFPSGISDIFTFDETAKQNPDFILDIIKGAMKADLRIFSFYTKNNDLIRITGYLVKKSEIEKYRNGEQCIQDTVVLGKNSFDAFNVGKRKMIKTS